MSQDQLANEGEALVGTVQDLVVIDAESFGRAGEMLRTVKAYLRRVAEVFDPIVETAYRAHRTAVEQRKGVEQYALTAERVLKDRMATYEQAEARKRREAEEAARREQERLEAEERARVAAEQRRLEEEAEEQRLAEALAAEQAGDTARAQALIEAPVDVPTVTPRPVFVAPPPAPAPAVAGVSFRDQWSAEVVSLIDLVRAVAAGRAPITYVKADEVALNQMARALKGAMNVPGVRVTSRRVTAARA
jgi:hypothetical protein